VQRSNAVRAGVQVDRANFMLRNALWGACSAHPWARASACAQFAAHIQRCVAWQAVGKLLLHVCVACRHTSVSHSQVHRTRTPHAPARRCRAGPARAACIRRRLLQSTRYCRRACFGRAGGVWKSVRERERERKREVRKSVSALQFLCILFLFL